MICRRKGINNCRGRENDLIEIWEKITPRKLQINMFRW